MTTDERILTVLNRSLNVAITTQEWRQMNALDASIGMDSMAVLEFMAGLEQEFGIRFPAADLELELFKDRTRLREYLERSIGHPGSALP